MTLAKTPAEVRLAQERANRVFWMVVVLTGVLIVTAIVVASIVTYQPVVGGESRRRDAIEGMAILILVLATPVTFVAALLTMIYLRWPGRWTAAAYRLGLFVTLTANAVLLFIGGWYALLLTNRIAAVPKWLPWSVLALSLFTALAPWLSRRLARNRRPTG